MPVPGSVPGGNVSRARARAGRRFPLRTPPPRARVRAVAADSAVLGIACLISYWLTTRGLHAIRPRIPAAGGRPAP